MPFVLEYELDINRTVCKEIDADNYWATGRKRDHIEFNEMRMRYSWCAVPRL